MAEAFDLNESREKGKTTKVAESSLVLGTEFLFTAFTFDCFGIKVLELNCFTLKYIICISVKHLIKNKATANC